MSFTSTAASPEDTEPMPPRWPKWVKAVLFTSAALIVTPVLVISALLAWTLTHLHPINVAGPNLNFNVPNPHWQPDPSLATFYCNVVQGVQTAANTGTPQNHLDVVFIADMAPNAAAHTAALRLYEDVNKDLPTTNDLNAVFAAYPCPSNLSG